MVASALALMLAASTVTAAVAAGPGGASAAKKKCKKKNKKKCKKAGGGALPVIAIPPVPVVRPPTPPVVDPGPPSTNFAKLTLDWVDAVDLDLHVWDSDGNHAGVTPTSLPGTVENELFLSTHSGDDIGATKQEYFEDDDASNRFVTVAVCYGFAVPAAPAAVDWDLTFTGVNGFTETYGPNPGNEFTAQGDVQVYDFGGYTPTNPCDGV